jgi:hypothetical protein
LHVKSRTTFWYRRFRTAAYLNAVGSILWTIAILLPFTPFSYLPPIIVGGGPGVWFLLGYVLYVAVGVGGFAGFSALLFEIETYEGRSPEKTVMLFGLILSLIGVAITCVLLGIAGASGGYALTIAHASENATEALLVPYVNPITTASLITVAGAAVSMYGMATAKATAT